MPLRVLITNITLATRTGTETFVRDLAYGLVRRGHHPIVYSPDLGDIAREIEAATVPVVNDLVQLAVEPDLIHGHHHAETLTALLHFPRVPGIGFCHDWGSFWDTPVRIPRVRHYVAVDDTCRDRLIARHGIPESRVRVLFNAVDLSQFPQRDPLPAMPSRALVFSNMATDGNYLGAVRSACRVADFQLDVIGQGVGASCHQPGETLGRYDVVFAKARCALEAMAVGAAVILCDTSGFAGLVTAENFDKLRRLNFGRRSLREPVTEANVLRELGRYSPADAGKVSRRVRHEASLDALLDQMIDLYHEVIAEHRQAGTVDAAADGRAAAESVRWLTPYIREIHTQRSRLVSAVRERDDARGAIYALRAAHAETLKQLNEVKARLEALTPQSVPPILSSAA